MTVKEKLVESCRVVLDMTWREAEDAVEKVMQDENGIAWDAPSTDVLNEVYAVLLLRLSGSKKIWEQAKR